MDCHIWAIDCALFLGSVVRSLADRGKNYTLSPFGWDALSSLALTAFPKDAGHQTVPFDVADSLDYFTLNPFWSRGFTPPLSVVWQFKERPQSLAQLRFALFKGSHLSNSATNLIMGLAQLRFALFKGSLRHCLASHPHPKSTVYTHLLINLKMLHSAPLALQFWGEPELKVPQNWGASAVLGPPQVEHLAWI